MPTSVRILVFSPPRPLLRLIPETICYPSKNNSIQPSTGRWMFSDSSFRQRLKTLPVLTYLHKTRKTPFALNPCSPTKNSAGKFNNYCLVTLALKGGNPWTFFLRRLDFTSPLQSMLRSRDSSCERKALTLKRQKRIYGPIFQVAHRTLFTGENGF